MQIDNMFTTETKWKKPLQFASVFIYVCVCADVNVHAAWAQRTHLFVSSSACLFN